MFRPFRGKETPRAYRRGLWVTAAILSFPAACVHRQTGAERTFAQTLVEDVMRRHPDVKGLELAGRRADGCVTIAASDRADVGDRCDDEEQRALRTGEALVEEPDGKDPAYIVAEPLHDVSGAVVGLLITDIVPPAGADRAAIMDRARAVRLDVESRIPSAVRLTSGTPALSQLPPIDSAYAPRLDPASFSSAVTNPYFPLVPGTTFRFRGTGEAKDETNVVTVMTETRQVSGIRATVVHDQVFEGGQLVEDTYDWYAQDAAGTVWYLGEDTKEYRNGSVVSTQGSWEAGVNGGKAGIIMWADPAKHVGETYRQEYLPGAAEDMGKVVSLQESVVVPYGRFDGCIKTEDTTPLEPKVLEHKIYCRGVGVVEEGESAREGSELVAVEKR